MRVLYVDHTSVVSGAGVALLELLEGLPDDVHPTVLCPPGELARRVGALGIPQIDFKGTTASLRVGPLGIARALTEFGVSAAQVASAARRCRADVVHANSIRAAVMSVVARQMGGPPVVAHVHDCLPVSPVANAVRGIISRGAAATITISDYTARNFAHGRPVESNILFNPLDVERFDPARLSRAEARRQLGVPGDAPLVGLIAQITPWKGHDTAIRALWHVRHQHPDARLLVVGEPKFVDQATRFDNLAYAAWLRRLTHALELDDAVAFLGERGDVPAVLTAVDVALAPSWEEPFGRSVLEAMAMEKPVVATEVGGPAEFIDDWEDGVLLPPRDDRAWGDAIARLLGDEALRGQMGRRARQSVAVRFERGRYVGDVLTVYRSVTGGSSAPSSAVASAAPTAPGA